MLRLLQLADRSNPRRRAVACVHEPRIHLLEGVESVYALVQQAIASSTPLSVLVSQKAVGEWFEYDPIYHGSDSSAWRILPPIDHPDEPARCLISGTGLTHVGSARDRDAMHDAASKPAQSQAPAEPITDSMRMFEWGLEGGHPPDGSIGIAPEWFYKGTGTMLRTHGDALTMPTYAEDGGEEAEIAGVYVIDANGAPRRIGMTAGNEFSDHRFERRNYLNLAGSKLRECAIGPELVVDPDFSTVPGEVWIERGGETIWRKRIASGETEMSHSLRNLEHHHFKFAQHRRPGDVHVHFFGAHSLSFGEGITLVHDDVMTVRFDGFGRALRNTLRVEHADDRLITVSALD
jgi:hypothetical protein